MAAGWWPCATDADYQHTPWSLLDAQTGAEIQTLPNPANDFYQQPRWHPDGRRLVAVTLSAAGKTIVVLDPATGTAPRPAARGQREPGQPPALARFCALQFGAVGHR